MRKINSDDLRESNVLKHYRIVRKWACKNYGMKEADLELLMYFDCVGLFSKRDYMMGVHAYTWDNNRFARLLKEGWIVVWRHHNKKNREHSIYKISLRASQIISKVYKILAGEDDVPSSRKTKVGQRKTYTDKVLNTAIKNINNDKNR